MDDKTLTALRASIAHWEENVAAKSVAHAAVYSEACPLCTIYWPEGGEQICADCPVGSEADAAGCMGTPWEKAERAYELWRNVPTEENILAWRITAQAELDFLKSLLPEGAE